MSDLLSIGLSGLKAATRGMGTVSDNISNAQTPGFARRRLELSEAMPAGEAPLYRTQISPSGVAITGLSRSTDQFLVDASRVASTEAGQTGARLEWLNKVELGMDDSASGIGSALTRLFNSADLLAANPGNSGLRANFLQNVDDVAAAFRSNATSFDNTADGIAAEAGVQVDALNADLEALQHVNEGLIRVRQGSTGQNALLDERDRLLDRIIERAAVDIQLDGHGRASVTLQGAGALLDPTALNQLSVSVAADKTLTYAVNGTPVSIGNGSLTGLSQAATHLKAQRTSLDTLAARTANDLNAVHQAGYDAQGNAGQPLLTYGGNAASLTALALSPDRVAAADSTDANGNMLSLSSLRGTGGLEADWASLVTANAAAVASAQARDAAATTRRDGAWEARNNISSVNLDQEAGELLRFQQAFEASARVVQVARETIQAIMNAV